MSDRDPSDPQAMRRAVIAYISHFSPETHGETETTDDEADMALEAALLEQGVISPDDAIESIDLLEWNQTPTGVAITTESGEYITISRTTGLICSITHI